MQVNCMIIILIKIIINRINVIREWVPLAHSSPHFDSAAHKRDIIPISRKKQELSLSLSHSLSLQPYSVVDA